VARSRRALPALLAVLIGLLGLPLLGVVVAPAASAAVTTYADLQAAFAAGGTVQLGADITGSSTLAVGAGKSVTLDLNGHALTIAVTDLQHPGIQTTWGALTIQDSGSTGVLNVSADWYGAGIGGWDGDPGGPLTIESGTVYAIGGKCAAGIGGGQFGGAGTIVIGADAWVRASPGFTAPAGIGPGCGGTTGTVDNGGSLTIGGDEAVYAPESFINRPWGTITAEGPISGPGTIVNHGTMLMSGGSVDLTEATITDHAYVVKYDANGTGKPVPSTTDEVWADSYDLGAVTLPAPPTGYGWASAPSAGFAVLHGTSLSGLFGSLSAHDATGSPTYHTVTVYLVDLVAPVVAITKPTAGAVTGGRPLLQASITDDHPDHLSFSGTGPGGATFGPTAATYNNTSGKWEVTPGTALAAGSWTFTAKGFDAAGNSATSDPVTFTVDSTAPTLTVTAPVDNSFSSTSTVPLSGTHTDANPDHVLVQYSGPATVADQTIADTNGGAWSGTSPTLADGVWTATFTAVDAVGNVSSPAVTRTFTVDSTRPTLTVTAPVDNSFSSTSTVPLSGTHTDANPDHVLVHYSGPAAVGDQTINDANGGAWSGTSPTLADGVWTATFTAVDAVGNVSSPAVTRTFTVDTTPPVLTVTTPVDGSTTFDSTPDIAGSLTDANKDDVTISYAGPGGAVPDTVVTSFTGSGWTTTAPTLADGAWTLTIVGHDRAGNASTTRTIHFTVLAKEVNQTPPQIGGTAQVGKTLSVTTPGTWSPVPDHLAYQWFSRTPAGSWVAITGPDAGPSYTLTAAELGKDIKAVETATHAGGVLPGSADSNVLGPVVPGVITNQVAPSIEGGGRAYDTLTVLPGTWTPADVDPAYQWLVDGQPVAGATGTTYQVRPGDVGKQISVRVTATKPGYTPLVVETAAIGPVALCTFAHLTEVSISGSPGVGETLDAHPGRWSPNQDTTTYQWFADGQPIPGATGQTFTVTPDQLGKRLTVKVTVSKPACTDASATSAPTGAVQASAIHLTTRPTISGEPTVGRTLTVTAGTWNPTPTTTAYQWLRGGDPIPGATNAAYTPTNADIGKWLTVVVTVTAPGYADGSITTAVEFPIAAGPATNTAVPTITGTPRAGKTLTAAHGTWSFTPDHLAFQWYAGPLAIPGATADTLVLDDPALVHQQIWVRETASGAGYPDVAASSERTDAVTKAPVTMTKTLSTKTPRVGKDHVTVDVTVAAPDGLRAEGRVRVLVDGIKVASGDLDGDGAAELTLPVFDKAGTHKVVIKYDGSGLLTRSSRTTYVHAEG
jgi:hypothetical protein